MESVVAAPQCDSNPIDNMSSSQLLLPEILIYRRLGEAFNVTLGPQGAPSILYWPGLSSSKLMGPSTHNRCVLPTRCNRTDDLPTSINSSWDPETHPSNKIDPHLHVDVDRTSKATNRCGYPTIRDCSVNMLTHCLTVLVDCVDVP